MNWRRIKAIALHDLRMALRNRALVIPLAIVSTTFLLVVPISVALALATVRNAPSDRVNELMGQFPSFVRHQLPPGTPAHQLVYLALVHLMAPLFIVLPVMLSSVLAADSFAGERERKTLEYLLHSPATDRELLVGKMLAAWTPALVLATVGVIPYMVVADIVLQPVVHGIALPNPTWMVLLFGVIPAASALTLGISVLISAKVDSFQAAYQAGPLVTFPFLGLMVGQITGGVFLDTKLLALLGGGLWLLAVSVVPISVHAFQRTKLFAGSKRPRHRIEENSENSGVEENSDDSDNNSGEGELVGESQTDFHRAA